MKVELCFLTSYSNLYDALKSLTGISRNQVKKYIPAKESAKAIAKRRTYAFPIDLINHLKINPVCDTPNIKIISEDQDFIYLSKPAKCHSHPLRYSDQSNLLSYLRQARESDLLKVNERSYDRGLLYRLDYETSGLVIYCRDGHLYEKTRENFAKVAKEKIYYAIVSGQIKNETFLHKLIYTGKKSHKAQALCITSTAGVEAKIKVEVIKYHQDKNLSWIKVFLGEGHRHQIRVQLSAVGYPILGDDLYGSNDAQESRMYLHCYEYRINDVRMSDTDVSDFQKIFYD